MSARVSLVCVLLSVFSACAWADPDSAPQEAPYEVSVSKVRTYCGDLITRTPWTHIFRGTAATIDREYWTTSQWILAGNPMTYRQLRRFIQISKLSTSSTTTLVAALDARAEAEVRITADPTDNRYAVKTEELLCFLLSMGHPRVSSQLENNLVDLIARFLPRVYSPLRGVGIPPEAESQRQLFTNLFYGQIGEGSGALREIFLNTQEQMGFIP